MDYSRTSVGFISLLFSEMAPRAGFEPATLRLTAGCSTVELPRNSGETHVLQALRPAARPTILSDHRAPDPTAPGVFGLAGRNGKSLCSMAASGGVPYSHTWNAS